MNTDVQELCELVIEYFTNGNAAGEYDGKDPRLLYPNGEHSILDLARKVQQQEEMRVWNN
jgi:hypothetical protein